MKNKHQGSCLCQNVKYEIEGHFDSFFLCHCKYCQKDTGSAHSANLFSSSAKLNWVSGTEKIHTFNLPATRHMKSFCSECGSAVPSIQIEGTLLVVPAGSLDSGIDIIPNGHLFCSSKADWEKDLEQVKRFETFPL